MKTRIISGIVMALILAAILVVGMLWCPYVITSAIAILAAAAVYELLHNAAGIKSKASWIAAGVYSFLMIWALDARIYDYVLGPLYEKVAFSKLSSDTVSHISLGKGTAAIFLSVIYFIYAVFMILKNHKNFDLAKIVSLCALPLPYAYAFSCLGGIINSKNGIYYLLLLLNFSSVCDMGAYFVGVTCGKHKLCPNISPKKTVEGAVGGIVSSVIVALILVLSFGMKTKMLSTLILTVPFCILSMVGDLFASGIKRSVGLKDYSNLIPGHGGILDRVDSIIMIAPLMYLLMEITVL